MTILARRMIWVIASILMSALLISGCSSGEQSLYTNAPGWSRAPMIGVSALVDPVPVALDDDGNIYFFLIGVAEDGYAPHVIKLNREGALVLDVSIPAELVQPHQPEILWDGSSLDLFYISDQSLYHAEINTEGTMITAPEMVSGGIKTDQYAVAAGPEGGVAVFFSGPRREPGLHSLDLNTGEILMLDARGVRPQLVYDGEGTLHALWALYPPGLADSALYYAAYPGGDISAGMDVIIAEPRLGISNVLQGPQLGLDEERVYIFWAERIMTGMQVGVVQSKYITFPIGRPDQVSEERDLRAPEAYELPYASWEGDGFAIGDRVDLAAEQISSTSSLTHVFPIRPMADELIAVFEIKADFLRRKSEIQIGVLSFDETPASYQLISFTSIGSQLPYLLTDGEGLYLTWIEKSISAGYEVRFATTAPDLAASLNNLTGDDVLSIIGSILFGFVSGILLLPMGLIWIVLPILILAVFSFLRTDDSSFSSPLNIISLVLSLGAYWASKFVILPGISSYVPFSAWIPILPDAWDLPLRIGVPVLIAAVGFFTAYQFAIRREMRSTFFFMLMYAIVDGLLTLGVYGVLIYGG